MEKAALAKAADRGFALDLYGKSGKNGLRMAVPDLGPDMRRKNSNTTNNKETLMFKKILFVLTLLCLPFSILAQTHGTKEEAVAMVDKALAHIKAAGQEKAFADFTDKDKAEWHNKDLYVFVVKWDGVTLAHGGNKALVGKSVMELKDSDGEPFMKKMIEQTKNKGSGWVDYKWANPQTKEVAAKSSYVVPIPGLQAFVGVGIYK